MVDTFPIPTITIAQYLHLNDVHHQSHVGA
jgi:hypothetical protein